jgi:hypothetical protein
MFKIGAVVIWVSLFAMVLSSVIRSEKIHANAHSVAQLHHTGKAVALDSSAALRSPLN